MSYIVAHRQKGGDTQDNNALVNPRYTADSEPQYRTKIEEIWSASAGSSSVTCIKSRFSGSIVVHNSFGFVSPKPLKRPTSPRPLFMEPVRALTARGQAHPDALQAVLEADRCPVLGSYNQPA